MALLHDLRAGERVVVRDRVGGHQGLLYPGREYLVAQAAVAAHHQRVGEAGLGDELHGGVGVEQCPGGVARCGHVVVDHDTHQRERTRTGFGVHLHRIAQRVTTVLRGGLVEHHGVALHVYLGVGHTGHGTYGIERTGRYLGAHLETKCCFYRIT